MSYFLFGYNNVYHEEGSKIFLRNVGNFSDFNATSECISRHQINVYSARDCEYSLFLTSPIIRFIQTCYLVETRRRSSSFEATFFCMQ
jgi:hypothetical protein